MVMVPLCFIFFLCNAAEASSPLLSNNKLYPSSSSFPQQQRIDSKSLFSLIPGRYPNAVSLPDVLEALPNTPGSRQFIQQLAEWIYKTIGIPIPAFVIDLVFEDSSYLLNYFALSPLQLMDGMLALNVAYQLGLISYTPPKVDYLPNKGFDLANALQFPLNLSNYLPGPPVQLAPNLWQGFYRGKASNQTIQEEIVWSLALNQLANNSHLPDDSNVERFEVTYNGEKVASVEQLLRALMKNGHSISVYLTWRAVDFFGWLTQVKVDDKWEWREVPLPLMLRTGVTRKNKNGETEEAIFPSIHDELVIEIKSGPSSKGTKFDGTLLWYEGDNGIGFFAGDLYSYASWVGGFDSSYMEGEQAVQYLTMASVLSDALIQTAVDFHLYGLGYGVTGVCVDSVAAIEYTVYHNITLYPLMMNKGYVEPTLRKYINLHNRNQKYYQALLDAIHAFTPDYDNAKPSYDPTLPERALRSISWPAGSEPFQCVVDARSILSSEIKTKK
ncbi:hypothetical protein QOT17_013368 [Balamuthia mandrillaris]